MTQTQGFDPRDRATWPLIGLTIKPSVVAKRAGPNNSDRKPFPRMALLPVITDYAKFVAHFGEEMTINMLGASGIRIPAQDVWRNNVIPNNIPDADGLVLTYNRLRGISSGRGASVVVRVTLPDGGTFTGTDGGNYRRAWANAMERQGAPRDVAVAMSAQIALPDGITDADADAGDTDDDEA